MTVAKITQTPQFIVGQNGEPTAIVLTIPIWEKIVAMLEDVEDFKLIRQRLKNWRTKQGWTNWDEFEQELAQDDLSTVD